MTGYAATVTFRIGGDRFAKFMDLMKKQAAASLLEDGCRTFQVWTDSTRPGEVFLWEVYTDRAAFDVHLASSHFGEFDRAVAGMVDEKTVVTWDESAG